MRIESRNLFSYFAILILLMNASMILINVSSKTSNPSDSFIPNTYALYNENFDTTTFMDVSTTAEGWGDGTVTNPRNFTWDWLDLYMTPHPVREIDVDGRHVYYVNYNPSGLADRDLQAVSLREPSNLVLDSTRNSWGDLISIAVEGHLLLTGRAGSAPRISSYNNTSPYELGISAT